MSMNIIYYKHNIHIQYITVYILSIKHNVNITPPVLPSVSDGCSSSKRASFPDLVWYVVVQAHNHNNGQATNHAGKPWAKQGEEQGESGWVT